jgi:hypothetical protein
MTIARKLPDVVLFLNMESPSTVPKSQPKSRHHDESAVRPTTRRRRLLRFSKFDEVSEIPHIDDLSDEEVQDVWISPEEFRAIRQRARDLVSIIEGPNRVVSTHQGLCTTRGLDHHTPNQIEVREAVKDLIYETVFRIQSFQAAKDVDARGLMAELCQRYSSVSVAAALQLAQRDAQEANEQ